jgi:hypothetical protein
MAAADTILARVYNTLGILAHTDAQKYNQIDQIVAQLQRINARTKINPKTTGTISERLCELALRNCAPGMYNSITSEWNWMADFSILGNPFNLLISVKSFKAKERLLVSGSGNPLSPTVGWGLFDDPTEWTEARVRLYLFRSFIAIYMPSSLYRIIPQASRQINNINGKSFIRKIDDFMQDLNNAINNNVIHITLF